MKSFLMLFVFGSILILCQGLFLQPDTAVNPQKFEHGLLWSIKDSKSQKISYLLGTVHQMDSISIKLPIQKLEQLAGSTEMVCVETIIQKDSSAQQTYGKGQQLLLADTTQNVMNSLDQNSKEKLVEIFSSPKISFMLPMLSKLKPELIMFMVILEKQGKIKSRFFKTNNFSPEAHFTNFAAEHHQKLAGLEQSGGLMTQLGYDKQSFSSVITEMKKQLAAFDIQDDIYEAFYLEKLSAPQRAFIDDPSFVSRNLRMVKSIDSLIQDHSLFIMVGMSHLAGEKGVLNQLAQKGYRLERMKLF